MNPNYYQNKINFFNQKAPQWMELFYLDEDSGGYTRYQEEFDRLFRKLGLQKGDSVLDVGCGTGILVDRILKLIGSEGKLYELDYAVRMIEVNKSLHQDDRIEFINQDLVEVDLPRESIGQVICFSCFPHFDDQPLALKVIYSLLRKNGKLSIAHFKSVKEINDHHHKHPEVRHDRLPEKNTMKKLLELNGFEIEQFIQDENFYLVVSVKK